MLHANFHLCESGIYPDICRLPKPAGPRAAPDSVLAVEVGKATVVEPPTAVVGGGTAGRAPLVVVAVTCAESHAVLVVIVVVAGNAE